MKIWLDDIREAPEGYVWVTSVNDAKELIKLTESKQKHMICDDYITLIDCDHDLGQYALDGGDAVKLLDWLEETGRSYPIRIHSQNPVGAQNMRRIIQRNGWKEVF